MIVIRLPTSLLISSKTDIRPESPAEPSLDGPVWTPESRLDYLDALRGGAALWVVLHHLLGNAPIRHGLIHLPFRLLVEFARLGWLGVSLFLVLSGFCLYLPLARRNKPSEVHFDLLTFAQRRARRILPPYYASLVICGLLTFGLSYFHHPLLGTIHGIKDIVLHLLLLFTFSQDTYSTLNPVWWSNALECQLYIVFPLLVWLAGRRGFGAALGVTLILSVLWQCGVWHRLGFSLFSTPTLRFWYYQLPGRAFEFAAGMFAAYCVAHPRPAYLWWATVFAATLLLPVLVFVLKVSRFGPLLDPVWGVLFASALILLSRVNDSVFARNRILRSLVRVGTFSYSLYLVHSPLVRLTDPTLLHLPQTETSEILLGMVRVGFIVGIAYLFHLAFERPFMSKPRNATPQAMSKDACKTKLPAIAAS